MEYLYKSDEYYLQYVGKYFKRITKTECDHVAIKILDFKDNEFLVEYCYLTLGNAIVEITRMTCSMVDANNFTEISKEEYEAVYYLSVYKKPDVIKANPEGKADKASVEYMKKQIEKHTRSLEKTASRSGVTEEELNNIRAKIRYYKEAVEALEAKAV